MERYCSYFKEEDCLISFMENYKIKESNNNIAATSMESFYNLINMYKELEKKDCKDKRKILKKLKNLLIDFVSVDSYLSKNFNYKGIANTHYRF